MKPPTWFLFLVAIALALASGYALHRPPDIPAAVAHQHTMEAVQRQARVETAFVFQARRLTTTLAHYDTVHDTLRITDPLRVRRFIDACDDLKSQCVAFRDTALALHTADSTVIAAQRRELLAHASDHPSRLHLLLTDAKWAALGFLAGRTSPRLPVPLFHLTF